MSRRDVTILLGVTVLLLLSALVLPRLDLFARAPFVPSKIAREIVLEVGEKSAAPSACRSLVAQLRPLYERLECRTHSYSPSEASERISAIVHRYRARPTSGWQIGDTGLTRVYRNPNQSEARAAQQMLFILVSSDLVVAGYSDPNSSPK